MGDGDRILAGRYRLVRALGRGGMGEVWEARDESLRRAVAVKVISVLAGGGSRADEARARFLREARITAALQHPNIVTVHDLGEAATGEGTTPFLVMELLRGRGMEEVIRGGPAGEAEAAAWGAQVCDALAEAHGAGVLHRDIKPANLFLTAAGGLKVLDFGIARAADPSATGDRLTHTGFLVGTAAYMAPEQARGRPEQRSDLYALGCVLFELLTGRPPFTAPDALGYLTAHLHDPPPAPSSLAPGVPEEWDRLVLRLLAKEPGERPGSAVALAEELRRLGGRAKAPPQAPRYTPTAADPVPQVPTVTANAAPAGTGSGLSRRGLLLGGAGAAALAAAGVPAALYLTGDPRTGPVAWSRPVEDVDLNNSSGTDLLLAGGRCYVASGADYDGGSAAALHAFDAESGEPLWQDTLEQLWTSGQTRFAVAGATLLALVQGDGQSGNRVYAFDAGDGERLWQREVPIDTTSLTLHQPSGLLLTSEGGYVSGIDPRTGESRWSANASAPYDASFVPAGDLVLFDGGRAVLGETGEDAWERDDVFLRGDLGHSLGENVLCYEAGGTAAIDLVVREARTGEEVWRAPYRDEEPEFGGGSFPPLASMVAGGTVFLPLPAGNRAGPTALDAHTGERRWTYDGAYEPEGQDGPLTTVPGGFVLPTAQGTVCLDARDGTERWRDEAPDTRIVRTTEAYALLYRTGTERLFRTWTTLRVLDAEDGREVWTGQFGTRNVSAPAPGDGPLVVLGHGGTLWALRV